MINIIISNKSDKPIYQQLYAQLSSQIIRGELKSDEGLPPIRKVAKELRISIITVKKAWEALERDGLICSVVGRGCFVADFSGAELSDKRNSMITEKMRKDISYYREMGLTLEEIIEVMKSVYTEQ